MCLVAMRRSGSDARRGFRFGCAEPLVSLARVRREMGRRVHRKDRSKRFVAIARNYGNVEASVLQRSIEALSAAHRDFGRAVDVLMD